MTRHLLIWLVAVVGGAAGCTTHRAAEGVHSATNSRAIATFGAGVEMPATGSVTSEDLVPGRDQSRWTAVDGLLAPGSFHVITQPSQQPGVSFTTATADLETAHWSYREDGSVALVAVDSHPDNATSVFDPPLLLAPRQLNADDEIRSEARMKVVGISNPASVRDRGTGTRTVRYVRDEEAVWRGAPTRAKVVEVEFVATLGTAKAERHSTLWIVPGEGVVAERWSETITILKLFTKKNSQFAIRE
ncbi:MAG: hypothetical protein SGJ11_01820 [Phycisphaerae bacterium]|nr:hypothetical protein [Phycisphaerae bacterium]